MHGDNVKQLSNFYVLHYVIWTWGQRCDANHFVYLSSASWILGCLSFLHCLAWCVYQVITMSFEVVSLVVQLNTWFFPLLSAKELFDYLLPIVLLDVTMPFCASLFLYVKTYLRSWFDEPWFFLQKINNV
jgi:hypothetical protein